MRGFVTTWIAGLCAVGAVAQVTPNDGPDHNRAENIRSSAGLVELQAAYPEVRVLRDHGRIVALYGTPMTAGATAEAAVLDFVSEHADAFGLPNLELVPRFAHEPGYGAGTVVAFGQTIEGLPVEYARARVMVNNDIGRVVFASGLLAETPVDGLPTVTVEAADALAALQADARYADYPQWSAPELVIWAGADLDQDARPAWKIGADGPRADFGRFTFFVDAVDGSVLETRNEIIHVDVDANVQGNLTPGLLPDISGNAPVLSPVNGVRVDVGGNSAFTDLNGDATVANGGSGSVTASTSVVNGQHVTVFNTAGTEQSDSVSVTPPGPANLTLAPGAGEWPVAQVNALVHTNLVADYLLDRGYNGMSSAFPVLPANVNWDSAGGISSCNAFWDGGSINFFREKGGCVNSAFTTVVAHEFGHGVVQSLGLGQGAFGEGFGDSMSILLYDTGVVGENFFLTGGDIRDIDAANQQYPCASAIHTCGQVLGGVFRDIRLNFGATYGSAAGLENARQLHVDWMQITNGGIGSDSAHPTTAIEVLTANDDDGNIGNGTPDYNDICAAFAKHGIDCPEIQLVDISFPNGLPTLASISGPTTFDVEISSLTGSPAPGTETIRYRVNGTGGYATASLTPLGGSLYEAAIPAVACTDAVDFYIETDTDTSVLVTSPSNAPSNTYAAFGAAGTVDQFDDNFETDLGWTTAGSATDGQWGRGIPIDCNRGDPDADYDGSGQCYLTDNSAANGCNSDVDGGDTRLITPLIDISGGDDAIVTFADWYDNLAGSTPGTDTWLIQMRASLSDPWTDLVNTTASNEWTVRSFRVSDYITAGGDVQVRFVAEDAGDGSVVEAGVDAFKVTLITCEGGSTCPEDLDGSGTVDLSDLAELLANFGSGSASPAEGDIDGDGDVDLSDLAALLAAFGSSCP